MVRIGKTLCAKVVHRIAVIGNFPALWLIFVVFPAFGLLSSQCRIWENLVFTEILRCLLSNGTNLVSFGFLVAKLRVLE